MSYDSGNFARKETHANNVAGAASASMTKFAYFARTRVKRVRGVIVTAGTNTAGGVDILNGTTSVGAFVTGTATAGSTVDSGVLNTIIESGGYLDIKGKANSGTLVVSLSVEEEVMPDAAFS